MSIFSGTFFLITFFLLLIKCKCEFKDDGNSKRAIIRQQVHDAILSCGTYNKPFICINTEKQVT